MTRLLAVLAVSALAASAAAQSPAPQPAPQPTPQPAAAAPERKPALILELDENSRRQILSGTRANEGNGRGEALPSLGGDARKIDPALMRGDPFPKSATDGTLTPF